MPMRSFEFEDFSDNFELSIGELDSWPEMSVDITYILHPAEPDVGIFEKQVEVTDLEFYLDSVSYSDAAEFIEELYNEVHGVIEDTVEAVAKAVRDQLNKWESELADDA